MFESRIGVKMVLSFLVFFSSILTLSTESSALTVVKKYYTEKPPTIAILDTGIDTELPIFEGRILLEVCVIEWASCPNGLREMEGPGAAQLPALLYDNWSFHHGTEMASVAVQTNRDVKIVFVRIIGANLNGNRQYTSETTVELALDWILQNSKRLGIQAVSMSQGHHNLGPGKTNYCPKSVKVEQKIKSLQKIDIPVFFPTGNTRDYERIDWPSCIESAIAIAATSRDGTGAPYSNHDPLLVDFFAPGSARVMTVGGNFKNITGTSGANVVAATHWATMKAAHPKLSYSDIYSLFRKTAVTTTSSYTFWGKLIDFEAAMNEALQ